jgi:hypothetical protein
MFQEIETIKKTDLFNFFNVNIGNKASSSLNLKNFDELIGMSKNDVMLKLGQSYNDMHNNVWMYCLNSSFKFTQHNYLYIIFKNNIAQSVYLKKFKTQKYAQLFNDY